MSAAPIVAKPPPPVAPVVETETETETETAPLVTSPPNTSISNSNGSASKAVADDSTTTSIVSKDDRRRFKKLRKKAAKIQSESDLSGIIKREEWDEAKQMRLQLLEDAIRTTATNRQLVRNNANESSNKVNAIDSNSSNNKNNSSDDFCPWVGLRTTQKRLKERGISREGFDHRLVLKSLYMQQQQQQPSQPNQGNDSSSSGSKKKRKHEDFNKKASHLNIPAWVSIHNPVCVDHLAVLEIQVKGNTISMDDMDALLKPASSSSLSPSINNGNNSNKSTTAAAATAKRSISIADGELMTTEWFQGPRPQSISDVLLYEKPVQPPKKKKKAKSATDSISPEQEMVATLQSMIMSPDELQQEGYPTPVDVDPLKTEVATTKPITTTDSSATATLPVFRRPGSFTLEGAKALVAQVHVTVENKQVPFVMDRSISSSSSSSSRSNIRVFGLDCEMVKTDHGTELGRITLIQYKTDATPTTDPTAATTALASDDDDEKRYTVIMDEFVLPYRTIKDYVTQYSGITAALLKDVTIRLEHIQASLLSFIRPDDIVVGHSLENDLEATRWVHPTVIDTAILFRSPNASFKHALKHLSIVLLKKKIQGGDHHCSEEDAAAALELALGRAEQGPAFAIHSRERLFWIRADKKANDKETVFVGPSQWLQDHVTSHPNALHALGCESIDSPNRKAVASWLTGPNVKRRAGLVWANLVVETAEDVQLLGNLLHDLRAKMSASTVLMISIQQGHQNASELAKRKRLCQNPRTTLNWSDDDEKEHQAAVDTCRTGRVAWVTLHDGPDAAAKVAPTEDAAK